MGASLLKTKAVLKLVRVKHWIKNSFVFAPLLFANKFTSLEAVSQAIVAFLCFSITASLVYVLNDIKDVESDRTHPTKSMSRPLASGLLTTKFAIVLLSSLFIIFILIPFYRLDIFALLLLYLCLNILYTYWLKNKAVIDIFIIATGFILRVYVGAVAIGVTVSSWMFITVLCLALFLASMKRRAELYSHGSGARKVLELYSPELVTRYAEMSSFGTLVFYSLYTLSENEKMIITIPIVLFGLYRYWYIVSELDRGESPTDVLFEDRQLIASVLIWLGLVIFILSGGW